MNKLYKFSKHTVLSTIFAIAASVIFITQTAVHAQTTTPLTGSPNPALAAATNAEIDRRLAIIDEDLAAVQKLTAISGETKGKLITSLTSVQKNLNDTKGKLSLSNTSDPNACSGTKPAICATAVDNSFGQYQAANAAAKIAIDLQSQQRVTSNLTTLKNQIQQSVDNAEANKASHVISGKSGFISLDTVKDNLTQLNGSIQASAAVTASTSSVLALPVNSGLSSNTTVFSTAFAQLSVSQSSNNNVGLGLSQMSNLTTGGKIGIDMCGIKSNCSNNTNDGIAQVCGIKSNCTGNVNNGFVQICGYKSDCDGNVNNGILQVCGVGSTCKGNTNNGAVQECGIGSDCSGSNNNGAVQICGVKSNCSESTNNGLVQVCGYKSDCSGSTNNGAVSICGSSSNCSGSTNNGAVSICGNNSDCSGSTNNSMIFICGNNSDCSTTIVYDCEVPPDPGPTPTGYVDDKPVYN